MAGLSALWLLLLVLGAAQEPTPPPGHLERVRALLAAPLPDDPYWRGTLFQSITRLEHAPVADLLPAWQAMAADDSAGARSNLILYCRRHGLPLPDERVDEGPDCALERALAAWGTGEMEEVRTRLERGAAAWPADARWSGNLLWLHGRPPDAVSAAATARDLAQAVLAARASLD